MTCPKCHHEHDPDRCSGHNNRGLQCGKAPMKGTTVCRNHGGSAPQVRAKAEERQLEQAAEGELKKLWVGLENATSVQDPVASMAKLAGALEHMIDQVGETVNDIKTTAAGANLSQVRGEIVLLERIASLLGRTLDSMARLGIEERHVQLQADQAALVTSSFRAVMALQVMQVLMPADRDAVVRTFLKGIGVKVDEFEAVSS